MAKKETWPFVEPPPKWWSAKKKREYAEKGWDYISTGKVKSK